MEQNWLHVYNRAVMSMLFFKVITPCVKNIIIPYIMSFFSISVTNKSRLIFCTKINMLEERNFRCYPHIMLHQVGKFDSKIRVGKFDHTCILYLINDIFSISSITL